jgi:hypothetical protein
MVVHVCSSVLAMWTSSLLVSLIVAIVKQIREGMTKQELEALKLRIEEKRV